MRLKNLTKNVDEQVTVAKTFGIFRCADNIDIAHNYTTSYMMMHMHDTHICVCMRMHNIQGMHYVYPHSGHPIICLFILQCVCVFD